MSNNLKLGQSQGFLFITVAVYLYIFRMKSTRMIGSSLRFLLLAVFVVGGRSNFPNNDKLRTAFEWKDLEYAFPSEGERQQALNNQHYIPHNGIPIDVDIHYKGEVLTVSVKKVYLHFTFQLMGVHVCS